MCGGLQAGQLGARDDCQHLLCTHPVGESLQHGELRAVADGGAQTDPYLRAGQLSCCENVLRNRAAVKQLYVIRMSCGLSSLVISSHPSACECCDCKRPCLYVRALSYQVISTQQHHPANIPSPSRKKTLPALLRFQRCQLH